MNEPGAASGRRAENDRAAPARRFVVVVGQSAGDSACRIEEPDRLLRVWSLLQLTYEQADWDALAPEAVLGLQRQLQAARRELEQAVSPPLAAELRRILPVQDAASGTGALRIECAVLLSWSGSLVAEMLRALGAMQQRLSRPSAAA